MGVELTGAEIDEFLGGGHTLILSTVRKSGAPFVTPLWYVWMDGAFFVRTAARSPKVQHIRRDPRVCCLVEEGERFVDLRAVIAPCDAEFVEDAETIARFRDRFDAKYAAFKTSFAKATEATRSHYGGAWPVIRMRPRAGELRSWHNAKLRMRRAEG